MVELKEVYRCNVCGNMVEIVNASFGELVCCNQAMELLEARTLDVGTEKHIPIIEKADNGITVKVGEVPHPMEEEHFIAFIELCIGDDIYRKNLNPGEAPEAFFPVCTDSNDITAREYCTVHGLWPSQ